MFFINFKFKEGPSLNYTFTKCPCSSTNIGCNSVPLPSNDPLTANQACINFTRSSTSFPTLNCSLTNGATNYSEQLNLVTAFIDGSNIYGSNAARSAQLRSGSGGQLKISPSVASTSKGYLANVYGPNGNQSDVCSRTNSSLPCFIGGEMRASNNLGVASVQTLFLREHNRVASKLALVNPWMNDDQLYNEARRLLIGIYQHIVYNEYVKEKLFVLRVFKGLPVKDKF